ncbi:hypothetical protein D3C73_1595260 [compost metagenome]
MAAPEAGHDCGLAVERAGLDVDAFNAFIVRAGENQMVVAGQDDVDPFDSRELEGGVFSARTLIGGDARMG